MGRCSLNNCRFNKTGECTAKLGDGRNCLANIEREKILKDKSKKDNNVSILLNNLKQSIAEWAREQFF